MASSDALAIAQAIANVPTSWAAANGLAEPSAKRVTKAVAVKAAGQAPQAPKAEQPQIAVAATSRSTCKVCREPIAEGTKRVGTPGRAMGRQVTHWCHVGCFVQHCLRVDLAPTGRAKCKADGKEIAKGEPRLLVGQACAQPTLYRPANAARTIVPELCQLATVRPADVHGLAELPAAQRAQVQAALFGAGKATGAKAKGKGAKGEKAKPGKVAGKVKAQIAKPTASAKKPAAKKPVAKKPAAKKPVAKKPAPKK